MSEEKQSQYMTFDPDALTGVVRAAVGDPSFEILAWAAAPLSDKGIINPDGLQRVSGTGRGKDGSRPWVVVLKRFSKVDNFWIEDCIRELRAVQAGFIEHMPGPLAAPRVYHTIEDDTAVQIWMEQIDDSTSPRWTLDDFTFAAHEIGRYNAACLSLTQFNDQPWLARQRWIQWTQLANTFSETYLPNPHVNAVIDAGLSDRNERLVAERARFFAVLDCLPQVIQHSDLHRRNLLIRRRADGSRELVAVDWAMLGLGPLGGDLCALVGTSAAMFEIEGTDLDRFDRAIFDAYIQGLHTGGWQGAIDEIRLAYTAWLSMWFSVMPAMIGVWTSEGMLQAAWQQFACGPEELARGYAELLRFALNRADEARALMERLGLPG